MWATTVRWTHENLVLAVVLLAMTLLIASASLWMPALAPPSPLRMDPDSGYRFNGDAGLLAYLLDETRHRNETADARDPGPVAAVVVSSPPRKVAAEEGVIAASVERGLEQGLCYALLLAAPWLVVPCPASMCAAWVAHLHEQMGPTTHSRLFANCAAYDSEVRMPNEFTQPTDTWRRVLSLWGRLASEGIAVEGQVPACFRDASPQADRRVVQLLDLLTASPATASLPESTRTLAAWLAATSCFAASSAAAKASSAAAMVRDADDDEVTVYGGRVGTSNGDVAADARFRYPRVWTIPECGEPQNHTCNPFQHVCDGGGGCQRILLPGILTVPTDSLPQSAEPQLAAHAIRQALERTALTRLRTRGDECAHKRTADAEGSTGSSSADEDAWWLMKRHHAVVVISSQKPLLLTRLRYLTALRNARLSALDDMRIAVDTALRGVPVDANGHRRPRGFADVLPAFFLRPTTLRGGYGRRLSVWASPVGRGPQVHVVAASVDSVAIQSAKIPRWVPFHEYKKRLDAMNGQTRALRKERYVSPIDEGPAPPDAASFTVWLGKYAHWLHYNYRRWREDLADRLMVMPYFNVLELWRDLAVDLVQGFVEWREALL